TISATSPTTGLQVNTAPVPAVTGARMTQQDVLRIFLAYPKVFHWLERYPSNPTTEATYDKGIWTVKVWSGAAGEIATGKIDDASGGVTEAWTGPQVAWGMARGGPGAFGGRTINRLSVWIVFAVVFFVGLADLRRPLSIRNFDLLMLLSFLVSLWYFNHGNVF